MNVRRTNRSLRGLGCSDNADCVACSSTDPANPSATMPMLWAQGGYPSSINDFVSTPSPTVNATTQALMQTTPDPTNPTAQVVAQSFQSAGGGSAQPGVVGMPFLNWVANNLSFVKPIPVSGADCPLTSWIGANPWLLIGGVALLAYMSVGRK